MERIDRTSQPRAVGIVGNEAIKFTHKGERRARFTIRALIADASLVVSGGCHLGGIDAWAIEEAQALGIKTRICLPAKHSWPYYRRRNIRIAIASDIVYSLVADTYPADYVGMRFKLCYHCRSYDHVKSGGCWTAHHAAKIGKQSRVIRIRNY